MVGGTWRDDGFLGLRDVIGWSGFMVFLELGILIGWSGFDVFLGYLDEMVLIEGVGSPIY